MPDGGEFDNDEADFLRNARILRRRKCAVRLGANVYAFRSAREKENIALRINKLKAENRTLRAISSELMATIEDLRAQARRYLVVREESS